MSEEFLAQSSGDGLRFCTIAALSSGDFSKAQKFPGFSHWADFDDFELERDSLTLGYECAGILAPRQRVPFVAFEGWSRLTGTPLDIDGLDEFAAHWRFRAGHPIARTRGRFGVPGRPEQHAVQIEGVQDVVIRRPVYELWRAGFAAGAPFPPPDIDAYAAQVVSCCLVASARARRAAFKNV